MVILYEIIFMKIIFCFHIIGVIMNSIFKDVDRMDEFKEGLRDGFPICLGYFSVSVAFGMMATAQGISPLMAVLISMTNLTSAGQVAGVQLIAQSAPYFEIAMTMLVINIRYSLMSLSVSQKLSAKCSNLKRMGIAYGITDEIFAVSVQRSKPISGRYFFGLVLTPYFGWSLGTWLGAVSSNLISARLSSALSIAIYGMFIAIIVPASLKRASILKVVLLSMAVSCTFRFLPIFNGLSSGWIIILTTLLVSGWAAYRYPNEEEGR